MIKRTVGSRLLEGYSRLPGSVRKYTDRAVKGGATVTKKMNGDSAKRKGEQWAKNQRSKVAKMLRKHRL
jgi:hypothetical protein